MVKALVFEVLPLEVRTFIRSEYRRSLRASSDRYVTREHGLAMARLFLDPRTYGVGATMPGPFPTVGHMQRANESHGFHFFDRQTMRSFGSRLAPGVTAGRLFITSEQDRHGIACQAWEGRRRYTVRACRDDGSIADVSGYGAFGTLREARRYARRAAALL